MSISSIGAYNIQALNLLYRLGATGAQQSEGSSTSLAFGEDSLSVSSSAQMLSRLKDGGGFKADFEGLGDLLQAGDLDGAKQAFAAMQQKMQAMPLPGGSDVIDSGFSALGKALDSGDTAAAQKAWKALQTEFASRMVGANQGRGAFQQDFSALGELLDAGKLDEAKAAYQTMAKKMKAAPPPQGGNGTEIKSAFEALGAALESGDLSSAQETWSTLAQRLEEGRSKGREAAGGRFNISELDALLASQGRLSGISQDSATKGTTE